MKTNKVLLSFLIGAFFFAGTAGPLSAQVVAKTWSSGNLFKKKKNKGKETEKVEEADAPQEAATSGPTKDDCEKFFDRLEAWNQSMGQLRADIRNLGNNDFPNNSRRWLKSQNEPADFEVVGAYKKQYGEKHHFRETSPILHQGDRGL